MMKKQVLPQLRLVYNRKKTATKKGVKNPKLGTVQLSVTYESKRVFLPTGVRVYLGEWSGVAPSYVVSRIDAAQMNEHLRQVIDNTMSVITAAGENFNLSMLSAAPKHDDGLPATFLDFMRERIATKTMQETSRKQHMATLHHLQASGRVVYFHDLTRANIMLFDDYLHSLRNRCGEPYRQPSIHGIHKRVRIYVREAYMRGFISTDPYSQVKIPCGKSEGRKYLSDEDIERLRHTPIADAMLSKMRDVAVFQAFTGLAYSDLAKFDFRKAQKRGEHYYVEDVRQKTGERFQFLLLSPALDVLKRHDYTLPIVHLNTYNEYLHQLSKECKLSIDLTSHRLRHTFATYALNHNVPIEVVARILGHTKIATTQIYAKLLSSSVEDAMSKLDATIV